MTSTRNRRCRSLAMAAGCLASLLLSSCCQPGGPIWGPSYPDMGAGCADCDGCGNNGKKDTELTVKELAHEIDSLEEHIEKYGSIVPKHADIWGQARLMMYRQEVERIMRQDAYTFSVGLQATVARSDQAFLANVFSLQAAATASQVADLAKNMPGADVMKTVTNDNVISRDALLQSQIRMPNFIGPDGRLMLEPTIIEDQKKRYLDHLHQLRRNNEGDDNADAPGYGLNLVRIPMSVLTGGCTQTGYGAECTFTANMHLPEDLLPTTFRTLVINDLVDLFGLQMTRMIEGMIEESQFKTAHEVWEYCNSQEGGPAPTTPKHMMALSAQTIRAIQSPPPPTNITIGGQSSRPGSQRPLPPSQILDVVGVKRLLEMAIRLREQVIGHLACKNSLYYLDVQSALREELTAAYDFLSSQQHLCLWDFCTPALVEAIRSRNTPVIQNLRTQFGLALHSQGSPSTPLCADTKGPFGRAITEALAWTIIVDAALLNARFLEDMKATHEAKGCPCAPSGGAPLFLPHPPPEVCQLFNDYVRCRWPLYVFALDPSTEDQNVGDSFSLRREMQLALSLAFTSGQIGASNFTRYVRRIEEDIQTIALNRTMIGFSHGDNTFGWRFYPRVQTPPIEGNLQTFFIELLWGARRPGYELRRRRLENGIRECVALVIMPSFVPYVDLEFTGNWFRLADPKCKTLDLKDAMRLSRSIKTIKDRTHLIRDEHCYRPGDAAMMVRRLDQLSERLPLQAQVLSMPFENTHGGFELLSTGVTNLGPELSGWYGAPGINPNEQTTLFLVGDNFSVNQTRVVVGGRMVDSSCIVKCPDEGTPATCECPPAASAHSAPSNPKSKTEKKTADDEEPCLESGLAPPTGNPSVAAMSDETVTQASFRSQRSCRRQQQQGTTSSSTTVRVPPVLPPLQTIIQVPASSPPLPSSLNVSVTQPKAGEVVTAPVAFTNNSNQDTTPKSDTAPKTDATSGKKQDAPVNKPPQTTPSTCADLTCYYQIPIFQIELLSRQVMRVVIPKGVYSDSNGFVDVHVATPYGVSQRISIPILCPTPAPKCADKIKISIPYCAKKWTTRQYTASPAP